MVLFSGSGETIISDLLQISTLRCFSDQVSRRIVQSCLFLDADVLFIYLFQTAAPAAGRCSSASLLPIDAQRRQIKRPFLVGAERLDDVIRRYQEGERVVCF